MARIRGGFKNLMLDAATPLFGLVIRLRTLDDLPNIAYVHKAVQNQVSNIRKEIRQHGYPIAQQCRSSWTRPSARRSSCSWN